MSILGCKMIEKIKALIPPEAWKAGENDPNLMSFARQLDKNIEDKDGALLGTLLLAFALGYTRAIKEYGNN